MVLNWPTRNKNCLWQPCLLLMLTDWNKISNLNRGPSIDASYQVSVHLAKALTTWQMVSSGTKWRKKKQFQVPNILQMKQISQVLIQTSTSSSCFFFFFFLFCFSPSFFFLFFTFFSVTASSSKLSSVTSNNLLLIISSIVLVKWHHV